MGSPDEAEFAGRVVVVTGGSRGLGREMVTAFAARRAQVVIASRKLDACRGLADEVTGRYGGKALPVACNVSNWADCDALVDTAYDRFGRVDVLVNNAGLSPLYPSLDQVSEALFDKVIGVNLRGPFRLTALIGEQMSRGRGGSIINISSTQSVRPSPHALPYAAAKAGLNALTGGFAHAFGPTVRVNAIMAGPFLTEISEAWDLEEFTTRAKLTIALQRGGRPDEIAGAAVFLASEASSFCTGSVLKLDGGYL
jgi:NAD(P)-dependent dehydrogenase (short-subunit alcohol dehydrogenase family)